MPKTLGSEDTAQYMERTGEPRLAEIERMTVAEAHTMLAYLSGALSDYQWAEAMTYARRFAWEPKYSS
jgi:hypothetical protein